MTRAPGELGRRGAQRPVLGVSPALAVRSALHSDLDEIRFWYLADPPEVFTLSADIDEFAYIRPTANSWLDGPFDKRDLAAEWRRKPPARRIWDAIHLIVHLAIPAAFRANSRIQTVRFHIGNMDENERVSTCRVSVEAKRGQRKDEWDWRYKRNGKGQLAPVAPHEDAPAPAARPRGFAADPREFELQVAQALQARGLSVQVTGGAGDEGVDIIARDPTPVTGGTYLVQCKRYAPDRKVGVAEVRELYGALQEKRASKGILATTASFTGAFRTPAAPAASRRGERGSAQCAPACRGGGRPTRRGRAPPFPARCGGSPPSLRDGGGRRR